MGLRTFTSNLYNVGKSLWSQPASNDEQRSSVDFSRGLFPFFGFENTTGEAISPETAMRIATVYSCIGFRADSVGMLPCRPYRQIGDNKEVAKDHPAYKLITSRPNPWMNAGHFWKMVIQIVDTNGNCYCKITRNSRLQPVRIDILNSMDMDLRRDPEYDEPIYVYKGKYISSTDVLHFKHYSQDGKLGISLIAQHSETIGSARKLRKFANRSLGTIPSVYATTSQMMPQSPDGKNQTKEYLKGELNSFFNQGTIPMLWNGLDLKSVALTPADVMYLDQISATKEEIYSIFKTPPALVGSYKTGVTYNNLEQQNLQWLIYGLNPLLKMIEEELDEKLFTSRENEYFVKFNTRALMQTDHKTQAEWFKAMWGIGVFNQDEIRDWMDMNPLPDGLGKTYYAPVNNMMPVDMIRDYVMDQSEPSTVEPNPDPEQKARKFSIRELLSRDINIHVNGRVVEHE